MVGCQGYTARTYLKRIATITKKKKKPAKKQKEPTETCRLQCVKEEEEAILASHCKLKCRF